MPFSSQPRLKGGGGPPHLSKPTGHFKGKGPRIGGDSHPVRQDLQHSRSHSAPHLGKEELQKKRDQKLCLHCGKPGHQWKDCPVGKSLPDRKFAPQRQLSTPTRPSKGFTPTGKKGKGKSSPLPRPTGRGKGKPVRSMDVNYDEFETAYGSDEPYEDYFDAPEEVILDEGAEV